RQPVNVIPVQVREDDGAGEGRAAEQPGDPAQAGARVQDEPWPAAVRGYGHARGVAAVADELRAWRGGRAADAAQVDAHAQPRTPSSRRCPVASSARSDRSSCTAGTEATRHRVTATSVDVLVPP